MIVPVLVFVAGWVKGAGLTPSVHGIQIGNPRHCHQ